jgi:hypothetical protein
MRNKAILAGFVMLLMIMMSFAALPGKTTAAAEAAAEDVLYVA